MNNEISSKQLDIISKITNLLNEREIIRYKTNMDEYSRLYFIIEFSFNNINYRFKISYSQDEEYDIEIVYSERYNSNICNNSKKVNLDYFEKFLNHINNTLLDANSLDAKFCFISAYSRSDKTNPDDVQSKHYKTVKYF